MYANVEPTVAITTPPSTPIIGTSEKGKKGKRKNTQPTRVALAGMAFSDGAAEFLTLAGSPAYSPFRLAALKDSLDASLLSTTTAKVTGVQSIHVHYVAAKTPQALAQLNTPGSYQRSVLEKLLDYGTKSAAQPLAAQVGEASNRLLLYVVPRKGTISPWSSKATSIAAVCGLADVVQRIERGVLIVLQFDSPYQNPQGPYPFADALHDRMTQVNRPPSPPNALPPITYQPAACR